MATAAEIANLAARVTECRICLDAPAGTPLPHPSRPVLRISTTARLCIAGQAPGARVHASGMPFADRSGIRLRQWMAIDEQSFYDTAKLAIVPMGFCFPGNDAKGGDLPPRPECARKWHDEVFAAMPQIELVLVIGQYAQKWHLGAAREKNLTATVMNWREILARPGMPKFLPLPHPSWRNNGWLRKNLWFEAELLPVLQQNVRRLLAAK